MALSKKGRIWIGTSNVIVPGNKTTFPSAYKQRTRLEYYASLFNTVEINSSFYKLPMHSTFCKWSESVPEDFKFSLKLSKEITHNKELKGDLNSINRFMEAASGIGNKKGCLLIQFPGKISLDYFEQVENILAHLTEQDPNNEWRKAVEFRHPSWNIVEAHELLNEFRATMVLHDKFKSAVFELHTKSAFVFLRFHGPQGDYRGSYTDAFLQEKSKQISSWLNTGKDVYAYFNNTIGDAFENARALRRFVEEEA